MRKLLLSAAAALTAATSLAALSVDRIVVEGAGFTNVLNPAGNDWMAGDICVRFEGNAVRIVSPRAGLDRLRLFWRDGAPATGKVYRDAWERTGGNSGWYPVDATRPHPWYVLSSHDGVTDGFGVVVQPNAFACWFIGPAGRELRLDLRAGSQPLLLGSRELEVCRVVSRRGRYGESAFKAARAFAKLMCPSPRLPKEPVFGYNDWYCAYGDNTATNFLADAAYISACAKDLPVRPYVVMDDGWQLMSPPELKRRLGRFSSGVGPWDRSSAKFGMPMDEFAAKVTALGAKPGLWYRPFHAWESTPDELRLADEKRFFDLSVPQMVSLVKSDILRFKSWGMKLVKIDYLAADAVRAWEREMGETPIIRSLTWRDRTRTTAEVIRGLYAAMREAAGDEMVIIGCNAFNHFAAGLFELQRTGDDTSGYKWSQTKEKGVNTLAMRAHQDGIFFSVDADCAGLAKPGAVPWEKNGQWIDLLGRSGTAVFVSWFRTLATPEVRAAIAAAYANAAKRTDVGEPLDWQETLYPKRWRFASGEEKTYDWD